MKKKTDCNYLKKNIQTDKPFKADLISTLYLEKNYLNYFVGKGNNAQLIDQIMEKRKWWRKLTNTSWIIIKLIN